MNIVTEYHRTIQELQRTKRRSHRRIELQARASSLLAKILRKEVKEDRKRA